MPPKIDQLPHLPSMPPIPSMEECRYIALQLEKGGYESIPPPKELDLLTAAEFRLLVQQALGSYRPAPTRRWRLGIAGALQSNARHFSGLEGMAVSAPSSPLVLFLYLNAKPTVLVVADSRMRRRLLN